MDSLHFKVVYFTFFFFNCVHTLDYTMKPSDSIIDGQTLNSQGGIFQLGFFTPSAATSSKKRYLGIWYKSLPTQTVVWVANRNSPILDTSGILKIDSTGNLVILVNQTRRVIWSSNSSGSVESPILEFLDSGNLVLRDSRNDDTKSYLWQSFDSPTDTLLPGMKYGLNKETGRRWYLSSWKNIDDPSHGDFTHGLEHVEYPEFIMRKRGHKYYRTGPWNGVRATGSPKLKPNNRFTYAYINSSDELYFTYQLVNLSIFMRAVLIQSSSEVGSFQLMAWVEKTNSWVKQYTSPSDRCDNYAVCGPYSTCDVTNLEVCQCLKKFKPKSLEDWYRFDWSQGCERQVPVKCSKGEGFNRITGVKLPDSTTGSWVNTSMNLKECRVKCLNDCACMAYAKSDIRKGGSGCILWFTDLTDMRNLKSADHDLYIRMAASELDSEGDSLMKVHMMLVASITFAIGVIALSIGTFIWKKRRLKGDAKKDDLELLLYSKRDDWELPLFDLSTITSATNNFAKENKLGEGGFGPVYKGMLDGGKEIAVKRLSKDSIQGINEFKNEVILISTLQHRNLVRIIGCCIQGAEKMLVYEYMPNNSLDSFIFDESKSQLLDWKKRYQIILGIARGLLYLHQDSRLKIIHRDLKASNILLDSEMVAKISDFGLARICQGDQTETITRRVIGTRGYMSPEYAVDGRFSVKSDVFSFGVIVLEIISGKRNRAFSHPDHDLNLLGHAWRLWTEDKSMQLVDELVNSLWYVDEISRCIHIGLLCVQKDICRRPTMSYVLLMLSSETALPAPQPPGFYIERTTLAKENLSPGDKELCNSNDATITLLEAR
ncbi:hypothetical protein ACHQM5_003447 [Ranunculus cassubicifolius]